MDKADLVELICGELKRQYEVDDPLSLNPLSWYTEQRHVDGTIDFIAIDGNPDIHALADKILEAFN